MAIEDLAAWLAPFGVGAFEGSCTFDYDGEIELTVETTADGDVVFLSAVLGAMPAQDDAAFLRRMLVLGGKGRDTGGGCLSVDETGEHALLWICWPVAALDAEAFEFFLARFLDAAVASREALFGDDAGEPDETPERAIPMRIQV